MIMASADVSDDTIRKFANDFIMNTECQKYGVPENYNPADHPPVKLRNHHNSSADQSETQRKRRSKNRLSNRRSTGYVPHELVEEALQMGPQAGEQSENPQDNSNV